MSVSTNAVSASIRARRKVNQLTEFCPKGWETKFRNTISYINALLRGVGHSGSEMLDANSRGQLYTFIVGAIRYNNGISAITCKLPSTRIFRYRAISLMHNVRSVILHNNEHTRVSSLHVDIRGV